MRRLFYIPWSRINVLVRVLHYTLRLNSAISQMAHIRLTLSGPTYNPLYERFLKECTCFLKYSDFRTWVLVLKGLKKLALLARLLIHFEKKSVLFFVGGKGVTNVLWVLYSWRGFYAIECQSNGKLSKYNPRVVKIAAIARGLVARRWTVAPEAHPAPVARQPGP